uniref:Zasp-like motif domain-containing protein n=1 Tax=Romanomermis culicivorax TaxID=13658 RepID=A0A915HQC0_ROMCU
MGKLHVGQQENVQQDSRSLAEVPCPPPAPPRKARSDWNVAGNPETITKQAANNKIDFVQNGIHQKIPKALKSAFERPEKDKKPFSYFASGTTPNLTTKPSPKSVKQANPTLNGPPVPKVLPIVTDKDLKFEEQKSKSTMPAVTAVTNSSQYNTPIALYSKEALQEEFSRRSAEPSTGAETTQTPNVHTRSKTSTYQTNESDVEDTPRYTGYVNPNSQSPCFKRLQYITGLNTDSEDERSIEKIGLCSEIWNSFIGRHTVSVW